jgi:hypothetical protein
VARFRSGAIESGAIMDRRTRCGTSQLNVCDCSRAAPALHRTRSVSAPPRWPGARRSVTAAINAIVIFLAGGASAQRGSPIHPVTVASAPHVATPAPDLTAASVGPRVTVRGTGPRISSSSPALVPRTAAAPRSLTRRPVAPESPRGATHTIEWTAAHGAGGAEAAELHAEAQSAPSVGMPQPAPPLAITRRKDEFGTPLDRDLIRSSDGFLKDAAFAEKWTTSLESPLTFFRAFPSAYYRDLRGVESRGVPGGQGIICGDPHPANFGFVKTAGGTEFVFNDFDDSGRGPVAIDALRYFTALRLAFPDKKKVFSRTLDAYVSAVKNPTIVPPPRSVVPQWPDVQAKNLRKFTSKEGFRFEPNTRLTPAPATLAASVRSLVEHDDRFGSARVLDVGLRERDYGGSAGLLRIWVLVKRHGEDPGIIELKEAGPSAVGELGGEPLPPAQRVEILKQAFLKKPASNDLFSAELDGKHFLARDRSRMSNVDIEDLSKEDRNDLLRAQASVMANVHRGGWAGVDGHDLRDWLDVSSEVLAERWQKAYDAVKR